MTMTPEQPVLLYQSAPKIYPRMVWGRFQFLRFAAMLALLGFYYLSPWIMLGDTPLLWFDLPHRRFHVFGLTLVPQDLFLLTWLLLIAALTLFFFTTVAGRLWCGYACPQTVWTEAFLWLEHLTEGDRHARMKLDRSPWNANKLGRKCLKHLLWGSFALFTGLTFVAYFVPAREFFPQAGSLDLSGWPLFWTLFYGFATWGNAGFLREQVCLYMCPYARFQSAMFDADTLMIAYDEKRGEPRKSLARKLASNGGAPSGARSAARCAGGPRVSPPGGERDAGSVSATAIPARGDCVDCSLCVQVCPMGIDIRQGLQYECIACAACIDVCDQVMDSVKKPRGLIRYTSEHEEQGRRFRLLRPRVLAYGVLWALLVVGFLGTVALRTPLEFDVLRDRHTLFRELPDGAIENLYTIKVSNKDRSAHAFRLVVSFENGEALSVEPREFQLAARESRAITVSVRTRGERPQALSSAIFELEVPDQPALTRSRVASFVARGPR